MENTSHEIETINLMHDNDTLFKMRKKEAIELRGSPLPRISESSDSYQITLDDTLKRKNSVAQSSNNKTKLLRKASFDSATLLTTQHTTPLNASPSSEHYQSHAINPRQVYLHLFNDVNSQDAILLPDNVDTGLLPMLSCYMTHKIGVIYIGTDQQNYEEKGLLSNSTGSLRYKQFLNGLGSLVKLKGMDTFKYNSGGLETDGSAGDFTLIWFDGITQFVFHVITMMPCGENTNLKKKHIGNDNTIIVYNESGDEYNLGVIRSEVNCVCIEIEPLKDNVNRIRAKTTNDMSTQFYGHTDSKLISDGMLPILVRKMAFHAELASNVYRKQKDGNQHGGRWIDRLKQINRIRNNYLNEKSKAASMKLQQQQQLQQQQINSSQQQQQQQQSQLQSSSFPNLQSTSILVSSLASSNLNLTDNLNEHNNYDFTDII